MVTAILSKTEALTPSMKLRFLKFEENKFHSLEVLTVDQLRNLDITKKPGLPKLSELSPSTWLKVIPKGTNSQAEEFKLWKKLGLMNSLQHSKCFGK